MSSFDFIQIEKLSKNKVFIVGSANGSGNLGDEGMFESLAGYLHYNYPGVNISTDAIDDSYEPPFDNVKRIIPFYGSNKSSKLRRVLELVLLRTMPKLGVRYLCASKNKSDLYPYYLELRNSGALIFSGAGAINSVFKGYGIYGWATLAHLAKAMGIDYFLTGHGIGPFSNNVDKMVAVDFIRNAKIAKVRDKISENFLHKNKVTNCFSDMDDATYIPQLQEPDLSDLLSKLGVEKGKYFVVSLHEWKNSEINHIFLDHVNDTIKKMIKDDYKVILLGNKTKGKMNDIPYLNAFKRKYFETEDNVILVDFKYTAIMSKTIISNSLSLLTTRYHPAIFTYENNIPVICVAFDEYYYQKFSGALMYREDKGSLLLINIENINEHTEEINSFVNVRKKENGSFN